MQTIIKQITNTKWSGVKSFFYSFVVFLFLLLHYSGKLNGQDLVFSQFNMLPTQANPAFAGNTYAPLIHINSRVQWPSINLAYNSMAVSYDQYFNRIRSGFGVSVINDVEGNGIMGSLSIQGMYSYRLKVRDDHYIKMGLGLGIIQKRLNWDKLIFPDQLDPEFGHIDHAGNLLLSDENAPDKLSRIFPDLSVGMLYYSPSLYFGIALHHANNPKENFLAFSQEGQNSLSNLYSFHFGWKMPLGHYVRGEEIFIQPAVFYSHQEGLNQLNLHTIADMGMVYAGIGYRHGFDNPDALILNIGFESGMYKLGYSYDLTVSRLTARSGGSHELGFIINFDYSGWFDKPGKYSDCFEIFR